jgi:hypothetical protein
MVPPMMPERVGRTFLTLASTPKSAALVAVKV